MAAAYHYLKENDIAISFDDFTEKIKNHTLLFVRIGNQLRIPKSALDEIIIIEKDAYTVEKAYWEYSKVSPEIDFTTFLRKVKNGAIPSLKFGRTIVILKDTIQGLVRTNSNYYTLDETLQKLRREGMAVRKKTLERNLDIGAIPHRKVEGVIFIHKDVVRELVERGSFVT